MVSCYNNRTDSENCHWSHKDYSDLKLHYDVWLVNGNPFTKHINPFEHQFSFEYHDVFEIYLAFFVLYTLLVPVQLYALSRQKHALPLILTICMCMEYVGIIFNFVHIFTFAFDGMGVEMLKVVGNFVDNVAQCLFMMLLLLIVKGWTITRMELGTRSRIILFTSWGSYAVANMALFVWTLTEVDAITDVDEWQTWPGYLILAFRLLIMIWFLVELRETFVLERNVEKIRFYLHFGAGFLVWFVYLPIVILVGTEVSSLWRFKTILSVTYSADILSYCVMTHLLWPSRSYLYFNLKVAARVPVEELEFGGSLLQELELENASEDSVEETSMLLGSEDKNHSQKNGSPSHKVNGFVSKGKYRKLPSLADELENGSPLNGDVIEQCDSGIESNAANGEHVEKLINLESERS